jgi:hypothetical protein
LCVYFANKRGAVQVVNEGPLAVDLDDGKPLAVPSLQLRIAPDVDLAKLELVLLPKLCERAPRTLAE